MILMVLHGDESWFNWGFPLTLITVPFLLFLIITYYLRRIYDMFMRKFQIIDASITLNKEFVMMYVEKVRGFNFKPGQYIFMNVPSISLY